MRLVGMIVTPILQAIDIADYLSEKGSLYEYKGTSTESVTKDSTADKLQPFVSKWYIAVSYTHLTLPTTSRV